MLRFVFFALIFTWSSFLEAYTEEENFCYGRQHYRGAIRHIEAGGIGYDKGYTTLETFLSSDPSEWVVIPFLDARGHIFDNGRWAANAGIGLRALWRNRVYGLNTYYDYRNIQSFNANQIGIGFETLGARFDFRINGYFPVGVQTSNPYDATFAAFEGNYLLVSQKYHSAMRGTNAEFGFHLGKRKLVDFYAAAGPYYFIGEVAPSTWGGKARIAGTFKDFLTLEISDSYDGTFYNRFQGQIALSLPFGPRSKVKKRGGSCKRACILNDRMLQPVYRQEIIVIDNTKKQNIAINPATGLPFFFVFVDNTSSSAGTYESPYPTLTLAQDNSSPNDIIYVFPGDGTTTGMDVGIALQANQNLWGSGISHQLQATQGTISIPALSSTLPTITNTDIDTEGNAVTLATDNAISGFIIASALNDAIYGADPQSLTISSCTFETTTTYVVEASFSTDASISITDNQFVDNVNGIFLALNGTSSVVCADNAFSGQTSVSSVPLEIVADSNVFVAQIENNAFSDNTTGGIRLSLNGVTDATINVVNNTITNSGTGSQASLGSSVTVLTDGTVNECAILLSDNTFSDNTSNALYLHTSGTFTNLHVTASANTMSDNGGSGLVLATPTDVLTFLATDNMITGCDDNGISVIGSGTTTNGNITINNNSITNIGNGSNGIAINQDFSVLSLTISDNSISECEGTGILSYAPTGIESLGLRISGNTISNCDNASFNAASGIDIEQYIDLEATIANNTLSGNTGTDVVIGSTLTAPTVCLSLTGNTANSDGYLLSNPGDGTFLLSPCNVDTSNTGTINTSGTIDHIHSCSDHTPCPP